jgi:hypothetical protein
MIVHFIALAAWSELAVAVSWVRVYRLAAFVKRGTSTSKYLYIYLSIRYDSPPRSPRPKQHAGEIGNDGGSKSWLQDGMSEESGKAKAAGGGGSSLLVTAWAFSSDMLGLLQIKTIGFSKGAMVAKQLGRSSA